MKKLIKILLTGIFLIALLWQGILYSQDFWADLHGTESDQGIASGTRSAKMPDMSPFFHRR